MVEQKEKTRKILVDTDCGYDDWLSIALLIHLKAEIVGMTIVGGNVDVHQATENVQELLSTFKLDDKIPVYKGASKGIIPQKYETWPGMGDRGIGGVKLKGQYFKDVVPISKKLAANAIIDLANKYKGELELVMIGPLTNLAIAIKLDEDLPKKLKKVWMMGGSINARGNSGFCSEFNFDCDPEAAHIVFEEFTADQLVMAPWEVCENNTLDWGVYDRMMSADTHIARVLHQVTSTVEEFVRMDWPKKRKERLQKMTSNTVNVIKGTVYENDDSKKEAPHHEEGFMPCDAYCTAAVMLGDEIITKQRKIYAEIELHGSTTRGAVCYDWYGYGGKQHKKATPNVTIIETIDTKIFKRLFFDMCDDANLVTMEPKKKKQA